MANPEMVKKAMVSLKIRNARTDPEATRAAMQKDVLDSMARWQDKGGEDGEMMDIWRACLKEIKES
jgi:hypothetical protein